MKTLKQLIANVEAQTKENFDLNDKRHFMLLDGQIKREISSKERKLKLIEKVLASETEDSLYDSKTSYVRNR